ncbi:MAG TPA: hypothetical protein VFM80_02330 [Gracilimonas sp.]|uniref:hypothetical protein n=1 Tax=Gracilimonas sp. TaxID=1974203 RepID=UPI002D8ADDFB|nr:hypothetical protein [Gracilimonas sp.]
MKEIAAKCFKKISSLIRIHLEKNPNDLLVFSFTFLIVVFIAVIAPQVPDTDQSETASVNIEHIDSFEGDNDGIVVIKARSEF